MITPAPLCHGSKVGIVAPSGCFSPEHIDRALERLRAEGWIPVLGKSLYRSEGIYAGTDTERAADLREMLMDSSVSAIFCARGGYGAIRLLPLFEEVKPSHPKWIVGYSDITALHRFVGKKWHWESLHGSLLVNMSNEKINVNAVANADRSFEEMCKVLRTGENRFSFPALLPDRGSSMQGELIGGNLSVLFSLRGTPYDMGDTEGKILFIEDIGEYYYHIDRMLRNFLLGTLLDRLAGIIVGNFSQMKDGNTSYGKDALSILQEAFAGLSCPVIYGFPGGHEPLNLPLIMGRNTKFAKKEGEWIVQQNSQ